MKTLEDKLYLNTAQQQVIDQWLDVQKRVWNRGLSLLKEFEKFSHYNKHDKAYAPCCPINWEYRWIKEGEEFIAVPYSAIGFKPKFGTYKQSCPIPQTYVEPKLDRDSEFSLTPKFAYKLPENLWIKESGCPYKLTQGTLKLLATSWQEYKKGKRKAPKFKGKLDNLKTLSNLQSGQASLKGKCIKLPVLGLVRLGSLFKRVPEDTEIKTYRIVKEPSGYYLMVVVDLPEKEVKPSNKIAGFDAGISKLLTDDDGKYIEFPKFLDKHLKKLKTLQQRLSRRATGSENWKKTKFAIAKLHEKIRRNRKAYHHKISTFAIRKYGAIAVEALNLKGMTKRPKKKLSKDGTHYEPNQAAAKAGLNRKLLDAGIGQLYNLLEQKAKRHDRLFEKVSAPYTSQRCNACGFISAENRLEQAVFKCVSCEHENNADVNAAQNIKEKFLDLDHYNTKSYKVSCKGKYPSLIGELKPVFDSTECQQEEDKTSSSNDVTTISFQSSDVETMMRVSILGKLSPLRFFLQRN